MEITLLLAVLAVSSYNLYLNINSSKSATSSQKVIIDTSALIDGRVVDIVASGFLDSTLIVPQFVLDELQQLADGSDSLKRERARFGLDNVKVLQESRRTNVELSHKLKDLDDEVDTKLIKLCLSMNAYLLTTDFNLMKVAEISEVGTMNINDLSQSLRSPALPGEKIELTIVQKGSGKDQGVGYLEDGTMVVVDGAAKLKNKPISAEVTRSLQTTAGRMLFAEIILKDKNPKNGLARSKNNRR